MAAKIGPGSGAPGKYTAANVEKEPPGPSGSNKSAKAIKKAASVPETSQVKEKIAKFNNSVAETNNPVKESTCGVEQNNQAMESDCGSENNTNMDVEGELLLKSPSDVGTIPKTKTKPSYSNVAERTSTNAPYRIPIYFRKNSQTSTVALTQAEKGKFIYRKLNVPRGKLLLLDDSKQDRITLKIAGDVPVYTLNLSVSLEAKKGLWTKPVAQVVKPVKVSINGTSMDTRTEVVEDFLKNFGILTSEVTNQKYEANDDDDEDAKAMEGVLKGDREAWIKIRTHIPSAVIIDNKKAVIKYSGQPRQCTRCLRKLHLCPAKGWPKMCEEIFNNKDRSDGLPRGNLHEMMDEVMEKIVPRDESGGTDEGGIVADHVDLENIPESMDKEQLHQFLVQNNIIIDRHQVEKDDHIKTKWRVSGLLPAEVTAMRAYVHGRKLGGDKGKKVKVIPG